MALLHISPTVDLFPSFIPCLSWSSVLLQSLTEWREMARRVRKLERENVAVTAEME